MFVKLVGYNWRAAAIGRHTTTKRIATSISRNIPTAIPTSSATAPAITRVYIGKRNVFPLTRRVPCVGGVGGRRPSKIGGGQRLVSLAEAMLCVAAVVL